jgi:RHS repeat-associated protein
MMNLGYTGKPYDTATWLYNYGYRDYSPRAARFTTADPVRDGSNWFAYVNNDPINWIDP